MNADTHNWRDHVGPTTAYSCSLAVAAVILAMAWLFDQSTYLKEEIDVGQLPPAFAKLLPLHAKLGKPERGDWLDKHFEMGQTYEQFLNGSPVMADRQRSVIYLQPLGRFNASEKRIIDRAAEFLGIYYQLPVKVREPISLDVVPPSERRKRSGRAEQIRSLFVLNQVLVPRLPSDAVALIALTTADLWPCEGWNRVYGQASLTDHVAVWSIHCFGDPSAGEDAFQQCLLRALKTGAHEMGHVFSANHCIFYECDYCGCNNLREVDRRPLEPCPSCLAKLCHATGADPVKRFEKLIEFYKVHGFEPEQDFCEKSLEAMKKK